MVIELLFFKSRVIRSPGILICELNPFTFWNYKKQLIHGTLINLMESSLIKNRIQAINLMKQSLRVRSWRVKAFEGLPLGDSNNAIKSKTDINGQNGYPLQRSIFLHNTITSPLRS